MTNEKLNMGGKQITNLADGEISETSTDAINGSQLYEKISNLESTIAKKSGKIKVRTNIGNEKLISETLQIKGADENTENKNFDGGKNIMTYFDDDGVLRIATANGEVKMDKDGVNLGEYITTDIDGNIQSDNTKITQNSSNAVSGADVYQYVRNQIDDSAKDFITTIGV